MPKPFDLPQTDPTKAYGALATNHITQKSQSNLYKPKNEPCCIMYP